MRSGSLNEVRKNEGKISAGFCWFCFVCVFVLLPEPLATHVSENNLESILYVSSGVGSVLVAFKDPYRTSHPVVFPLNLR